MSRNDLLPVKTTLQTRSSCRLVAIKTPKLPGIKYLKKGNGKSKNKDDNHPKTVVVTEPSRTKDNVDDTTRAYSKENSLVTTSESLLTSSNVIECHSVITNSKPAKLKLTYKNMIEKKSNNLSKKTVLVKEVKSEDPIDIPFTATVFGDFEANKIQTYFELPSTSTTFNQESTKVAVIPKVDHKNYSILAKAQKQNKQPDSRKSNLKRKCHDDVESQLLPKMKRGITFDSVTVYYFPRAQGFTCVPYQGGSTLGMAAIHSHMQRFSLIEHGVEQQRLHRQILQQLRSERHVTTGNGSFSDENDSEEEPSDASESELDLDSNYSFQPVSINQRRALLRAAGVRKIDGTEKDECRDIRTSREFCGCRCNGFCDPVTCSCSRAGIKCQVDRLNFPCRCTRDSCANSSGRIEFNSVRVRKHFIHTLMQLELEKKQNEEESKTHSEASGISENGGANTSHWFENERLRVPAEFVLSASKRNGPPA